MSELGQDGEFVRPGWSVPANVTALCTTTTGGCSVGSYASNNLATHVGDNPRHVDANRQSLAQAIRANHVQWLQQVHGFTCVRAHPQQAAELPEADAMWTDVPGLALAILTADCVPVLVSDKHGKVVGAAHAGWQGLHAGVIEALLAAMSVQPHDLRCWIGPCIGQAHYEVGADVWGHFADKFDSALAPHATRHTGQRADADKRMLDLAAVAAAVLSSAGVAEVTRADLCTYADARFYSHRQCRQAGQNDTGRMASVIMRA